MRITHLLPTCVFYFLVQSTAFAAPPPDPICLKPILTPATQPCATNPKSAIQGDTLYIDGAIDGMTYDLLMFGNAVEQVKHVELNSYGGDLNQGEFLAQLIRSRQMTTHLRAGAFCASTCVLLMQAGVVRTAEPGTQFGIHGVRFMGYIEKFYEACGDYGSQEKCDLFTQQWYRESLEATQDYFSLLQQYGASPTFFSDYMKQGDDPNWYRRANGLRIRDWVIGVDEARQYGLVSPTATGIEQKP